MADKNPYQKLEGQIEIIAVDSEKKLQEENYIHVLIEKDSKEEILLNFKKSNLKDFEDLSTGDEVTIEGFYKEEVRGRIPTFEVAHAVKNPASINLKNKALNFKSTLVILVNFTDEKTDLLYPLNSIKQKLKRTNLHYLKISRNQAGLELDLNKNGFVDTVTVELPYNTLKYSCDSTNSAMIWRDNAIAAAKKLGHTLNYQIYTLILPPRNVMQCSWTGLATVGPNCETRYCTSWITLADDQTTYEHEIGHNYGLKHSSLDTNNDGDGEIIYGDESDIMSYSRLPFRGFNGLHMDYLGWNKDDPNWSKIIDQSTTVRLYPLHLPSSFGKLQMVKILDPINNRYYTLSYRRAKSVDKLLAAKYLNGVHIHHSPASSAAYGKGSNLVKQLTTGSSFAITPKVIVTQTSLAPSTSYVDVKIDFLTP